MPSCLAIGKVFASLVLQELRPRRAQDGGEVRVFEEAGWLVKVSAGVFRGTEAWVPQ